jgi:hypothetical protein
MSRSNPTDADQAPELTCRPPLHLSAQSSHDGRKDDAAALSAKRPKGRRDRFRRNPAAHALSSDTCSAFVRSISVATPTSLLSAERRRPKLLADARFRFRAAPVRASPLRRQRAHPKFLIPPPEVAIFPKLPEWREPK